MNTAENPPVGTRPDPFNPGWFLGWGALRMEPWDLAGFFGSEGEARQECARQGNGYEVAYGSNQAGTDSFVVASGGR